MPTGTLVLPAPSDVRLGVGYGAGGTELFGTLIVPPTLSNAGPVWLDLRKTTQSLIQALALTYTPLGTNTPLALPSGNVIRRRVLSVLNVAYPHIQICRAAIEGLDGGSFESTEIVYPVLVATVFAVNQDVEDDSADPDVWRQAIIDAFLDLPRPEVTSANVQDCQIVPAPALDLQAFREANLEVGAMVLQFRTRKARPGH